MLRRTIVVSIMLSALPAFAHQVRSRETPRQTPSIAIRDAADTPGVPIGADATARASSPNGSRRLTTNNEQNPDPCVTMPDLCDAYNNGGTGGGSSGGGYSYCVAVGSKGEKCWDTVTIYSSEGTLCAAGCETCAAVRYSAHCSCNATTLKLSGTCTYW
jgi:hypothetical protein